MNEYLICFWAERYDAATDLEKIVEAKSLESALEIFKRSTSYKSIESISRIPNIENVILCQKEIQNKKSETSSENSDTFLSKM